MGDNTMWRGCDIKLPPVHHKTLPDHARVFMYKSENYWVWVDTHYTRVYDDNSLPDTIKSKLVMVLATPRQSKLLSEEEVKYNTLLAYMNSHNTELDEVGWQVTESIFCIVLPTQFLHSLKGETLNKETI